MKQRSGSRTRSGARTHCKSVQVSAVDLPGVGLGWSAAGGATLRDLGVDDKKKVAKLINQVRAGGSAVHAAGQPQLGILAGENASAVSIQFWLANACGVPGVSANCGACTGCYLQAEARLHHCSRELSNSTSFTMCCVYAASRCRWRTTVSCPPRTCKAKLKLTTVFSPCASHMHPHK